MVIFVILQLKNTCKSRVRWKCYLLEILVLLILSLSTTFSILWLFLVFFKRKTLKVSHLKPLPKCMGKGRDNLNDDGATIFKQSSLQLTFSEVVHITNNFSKSNVIGDGGSGIVYKGVLPSGQLVAVKKLGKARDQGSREFLAEMEAIGSVKHNNLIPLLGFCSLGGEKLLIYEFMVNGSLDIWLRNKPGELQALDWDIRLKIALGTARGLAFLHHSIVPPIIHRDIKASNILLDHKFEPRIADFGLARTLSVCGTHVTTEIAGTFGYIAPEYGQSWRSTTKGDVYSFGVLVLEIITGKEPTGPEFKDMEGGNLVGWVRGMVAKGKETECVDGKVFCESTVKAGMLKLLHLGLNCTN
ncbi:Receptor-like kinase [Melia azedarach]|uniref:Receptor-like kinase n=1 Tax=Melia azedarach TaxID=155640 RepID=A0ACC1X432_MELAZ|nr:Receptor-like kinase [Melia azedarach]